LKPVFLPQREHATGFNLENLVSLRSRLTSSSLISPIEILLVITKRPFFGKPNVRR
jgi:hypothetical protein